MSRQPQSLDLPSPETGGYIALSVPHNHQKPITPPSPLHDFLQHNKGLFIIAVSQFFFSLMELSVKVLTALDDPVPMFEVVTIRMVITYLACQIYMRVSGVADPALGPRPVRGWLVLRGLFGFTGLFGLYYSLQYMSLSDATTLTFLVPTVTAAFGYLLLREPVSWKQAVAGLVSLSGVVLIAKPTFIFGGSKHADPSNGHGGPVTLNATTTNDLCRVSLIGVLGSACAYITIRFIGKRAHPMHLMSYYALWSVIVSTGAMYVTNTEWVLPRQAAWSVMLVIVGICGFIAQLLLTFGLQLETASRGSLVFYIQIVFAIAFERLVFGTTPSGLSIIGIFVIIASAIYVVLNRPPVEPPVHTAEEARGLLGEQEDLEYDATTPEGITHRSAGGNYQAENP